MFELPRVMGHRGAAGRAPENTLAGLRTAAALGLDWVEFDVMLTGDGVPVLFHDDNLKRTTGKNALMAKTPYAALASLEAGTWFGPDFAGEPVPSLEMAIAQILELNLRANIEIKPTPGCDEETAAAALEVLARCWPGECPPPLISSFSRAALAVAKQRAPALPRALIAWQLPRDWATAAAALECVTLHLRGARLRGTTVEKMKRAGYGVAAFTINKPARARRLLDLGVDCIITDVPDTILAAIE